MLCPPKVRRCTKCGDVFPMECFGPQKKGKWGRRAHCAACHRKDVRDRELMKLYGLTRSEYQEMLLGGCGICGKPNDPKRNHHVDHDHKTGVVRGILCYPCNAALGYFYDDPTLMRRGAEWVETSGRIPALASQIGMD